jgi:hypothetical protein
MMKNTQLTNIFKSILSEGKKIDQDGDGDKDFADVMIARLTASGKDKDDAIKFTKNKKYNKKSVKEGDDNMTENYMFFSNLKQMHRQIEFLMQIDPQVIESILQNGHDWADDHVTVAKENMDQVFDFIMNKTK